MTENEKINEMAKDLTDEYKDGREHCRNTHCEKCDYINAGSFCLMRLMAEKLYSKSYRKASEVAKEVIADIRQSLINMVLLNITGEEYDLAKAIADIEKKYTEGEK